MQKMLTQHELAEMVNLTVGAIRKWRAIGYGPQPIKIGDGRRGAVRYRYEDVIAFIESRLRK
jgi:predicted DNA-binding transcriptional regulator AlpA